MKFLTAAIALTSLAALGACGEAETGNVETEAADTSAMLENRADQISAEAENGVESVMDTLENQAAALEEQFEGNGAAEGNQGSAGGDNASADAATNSQ